jgi:DNA uptake protein ComE-like DNA-binding protein
MSKTIEGGLFAIQDRAGNVTGYVNAKGEKVEAPDGAEAPAKEQESEKPKALTNADALPADFPGRAELEAAKVKTLGAVPRTLADLEKLDGIGPATAAKILAYPGLPAAEA